jgi:hypothetical protein
MNETHILIRLLRMYIPRNWEFGSASAKLRNFGGGPPPFGTPLVLAQGSGGSKAKALSFIQNVQAGSVPHPVSLSVGMRGLFPRSAKLTTHLHLMPRLRMTTYTFAPLYALTAWTGGCLPSYNRYGVFTARYGLKFYAQFRLVLVFNH